MEDARHEERERELFAAAAALAGAERAALLGRECGADAALRARLEVLLAAHDAAGGFMAAPTGDDDAATALAPLREGPGTRIGPYKLLQLIGEGGFGTVFMAEQERPVVRKVALKIIKLGMDTRQVIARFEAERQALALMDHPNIARVFDAGATETGRPYFVMELVRGEPITEYCDRNNLSIEERLRLFEDVCHAVQHAHQKGIIHRDLKPSNVLVTSTDGKPVPKVIDFGIAKATAAKLTEKTLFTEHRALIGTPEYMSPEQAEMTASDIDTRSDIYSLGVLLYELLTGALPFDSRRLRSAAYAEIQRIIREEEPPKPSTRFSTLDSLPSVAAHRRIEPARLSRLVKGDLDWIVMKALEKDRTRRYETANGLAADVQRHRAGEAVVAAPPSAAYRLRKLMHRNRVQATAGALVLGALILGVIGTGVGLYQARLSLAREKKSAFAARRSEAEAIKQATRSQRVADLLKATLAGAAPAVARGRDATILHEILTETSARLNARLPEEPEIEAELRTIIGVTLRDSGDAAGAERELNSAIATYRSLGDAARLNLADAIDALAELLIIQTRWNEARIALEEAATIRTAAGLGPSRQTAVNLDFQGQVAYYLGDRRRAELLFFEAIRMKESECGENDLTLVQTLNSLSILKGDLGQTREAVVFSERALTICQQAHPDDHPDTATTLSNLGMAYQSNGRPMEAEEALRRALGMHRHLLGPDHQDVGIDATKLAAAHEDQGEFDEAEALHREARRVFEAKLGAENPFVSSAQNNLGLMFLKKHDYPHAEEALTEALALSVRTYGDDHYRTAIVRLNLADALFNLGSPEEAEPLGRAAAAVLERQGPDASWLTGLSWLRLGRTMRALIERRATADAPAAIKSAQECEALLLKAHDRLKSTAELSEEARTGRLSETAGELAALYTAWDALQPASGKAERAAEWRAKVTPENPGQ